MTQEEIQEAVDASPLFRGCKKLESSMSLKVFRKGQIVSERQTGQEILGLIVTGNVEVYSIAMDGREIILSQLKRGDSFGLINLFTDTELPTVLKCRNDTTILTIPKRKVLEIMKSDEELAFRYACICNQKMQFLISRIEFLTMQSGRNKLTNSVFAHEYGTGRGDFSGVFKGNSGLNTGNQQGLSVSGVSRASGTKINWTGTGWYTDSGQKSAGKNLV